MKKILLVLVMIAASVFLAQPAIAAEGDTGDTAVTETTEATTATAEPEVVNAEEPPPVVEEQPAPVVETAPAPAPEAPPAPAADDPAPAKPKAAANPAPKVDSPSGDLVTKDAVTTDSVEAAAVLAKVWVCKYVGKPGVDERLKEGKNPISVSSNATVGTYFDDGHGRSYVLATDNGGPAPDVSQCPVGDADTEVTTEDPILSPATCSEAGALTLPNTAGVLYTVTPNYTGDPGTYDVVATALPGYVLSDDSQTEWNDIEVAAQLSGQVDCPVIIDQDPPKKVWVCKYVGTPGVDEVLKGGKNPIEVSVNSLPNAGDDVKVGDEFADAHERSLVVALSPADPEPTVADCAPPIVPTEVSAEAPTVDPATCEDDGTLNLPDTPNVVYTVEPEFDGPGDYVITATAASDEFKLIGPSVFEVTVDAQTPLDECVAGEEENSPTPDKDVAKEDDLLPDTGGLPLWVLLLAGPMTAAGLLILMRRQPVDHASTSGRMPTYSLILPPANAPVGVKRVHASTQHIGFMKAVGNVVAAIGSFLRGGRR